MTDSVIMLCRSWRIRERCSLTITFYIPKRLWGNR